MMARGAYTKPLIRQENTRNTLTAWFLRMVLSINWLLQKAEGFIKVELGRMTISTPTIWAIPV